MGPAVSCEMSLQVPLQLVRHYVHSVNLPPGNLTRKHSKSIYKDSSAGQGESAAPTDLLPVTIIERQILPPVWVKKMQRCFLSRQHLVAGRQIKQALSHITLGLQARALSDLAVAGQRGGS